MRRTGTGAIYPPPAAAAEAGSRAQCVPPVPAAPLQSEQGKNRHPNGLQPAEQEETSAGISFSLLLSFRKIERFAFERDGNQVTSLQTAAATITSVRRITRQGNTIFSISVIAPAAKADEHLAGQDSTHLTDLAVRAFAIFAVLVTN